MKKVLIILACALITACKDRGACLESHTATQPGYMQTTYIQMGNTTVPQLQWIPEQQYAVCDRYEFPNGRPKEKKNG